MPMPNGGLITENNRQYYSGVQSFISDGVETSFETNFNTDLVFYNSDPLSDDYYLNNFKIYTSPTGLPGSFTELTSGYFVGGNTISLNPPTPLPAGTNIVIQLKTLNGGNYGNEDAFGTVVEENYGGYQYIKLKDIVYNFMMIYVGNGKLIPDVKRTDVIFHAKRGLQEFSYDTLKSVKSQELTVPPSLSVIIPQDFVNYVKMSWVDSMGVKHPIYPANNLTSNPTEIPLQDDAGVEIQDEFNNNIQTESIMEERWSTSNTNILDEYYQDGLLNDEWNKTSNVNQGRLYGIEPQYAQANGWFTINDRENKISFSSSLAGAIVVIDYISDGLAYDLDSRLPKMAEEAMYAHILHAIIATRSSSPEYLVQRLKHERSAKLRNTKIRLSNIKIEEITQVFRGKSKWIKH